jgi:hypothetical protein
VAVLLVEQQMRRALAAADRWYLLASGAVVSEGRCDSDGAARLERAYLASMGISGQRPPVLARPEHRMKEEIT